MKRFIKELKENRLIIIIILLTIILTSLFNTYLKKDYSRVNNETTDFVSAKVTEVTSSEVEYDNNLDINLGKQVVKVEILEGKSKGKELTIDNYLTAAHNVEVKTGSRVIISADEPDGIEAYYTVYNFDRELGIEINYWISLYIVFSNFLVITNSIFRLSANYYECNLCNSLYGCYIDVIKWKF